ncbi:MAG: glucose PTS transporter subunit EIIB, partial [Aeromonas sp.]
IETNEAHQPASEQVGNSRYNGEIILNALGGADNILALDNCITRLRMSVQDMSRVDDKVLKANGAIGVIKLDEHNLQVVIGPQVHLVKNQLQSLMGA